MGDDERTNEQLVVAIQNGEDQHGELVLALMQRNKGFLYTLCKPFIRPGVIDPEELQTFYFLAVCGAVDACKINTASFYSNLRWAALKELISATAAFAPVRVSRNLLWALNRYNKARQRYLDEHNGEEPSATEMTQMLGVSATEIARLESLRRLLWTRSLDEPIDYEDDSLLTLGDTIASPDDIAETVVSEEFLASLRKALHRELQRLPDTEREAVVSRFFRGVKCDRALAERGLRQLKKPATKARLQGFLTSRNVYRSTSIATFRHTLTGQPEAIVVSIAERGDDRA